MAGHAFDPQAAAFRSASEEDWVDDEALAAMLADGSLADTSSEPVVPVEVYEDERWDADRHPNGPKTVAEARELLRARVEDPAAPDRDATLYDDLSDF